MQYLVDYQPENAGWNQSLSYARCAGTMVCMRVYVGVCSYFEYGHWETGR